MLHLLSLLQARRDWRGSELASRMEVSARTVRRDVDRLRELGYRITAVKGPDGGYRIEAGSELPPLLFDDGQAVALAIALQNSSASGVDIAEGAARALATVRNLLPSHLRHRIDSVDLTPEPARDHVHPDIIDLVSTAIRERAIIRFTYAGQDASVRRVEPHGLVTRDRRWYLVAWETEREHWRIFRLDRMVPRTPTGPRFAPRAIPTGAAGSYVDARFKGATHENRWPCVAVFELDLPLRDVLPWLDDGHAEAIDDARCRVTVGSWSWMGALAAITRFDADFRVVGPAALAKTAEALAARLTAASASGAVV